ncbi:MAG: GTPase HflX [Proteobacteria bacterium]|nr:GTPase HflX [Pseudomonadota bacterium]
MKTIYGNVEGLKANQIKRIENLYRRRTPPEYILTPELCREIVDISHEIRRQIALLINRSGKTVGVIVGTPDQIVIPKLNEYHAAPGRLNGLKCIHTHLKNEALTKDDLTDLSLLRLDLMAAVTITNDGLPLEIHAGHIEPGNEEKPYVLLKPLMHTRLDIGCMALIRETEASLSKLQALLDTGQTGERAILVHVTTGPKPQALDSLAELKELARSSDIQVIDTVLQQRKQVDPKFIMGKGKLADLTITALQKNVSLIVFDQELDPGQIRLVTDQLDLKVIDRTQLILDIFAQRAKSREGKLQVELAQLKYLMPRLITKNTAMSRLTGGIGGRGPGETKLEIHRRRARERILKLQKEVEAIQKNRKQQKSKRNKKGVPVISIVGYTNAGKSTLLNTMTKSKVFAEDKLFATLDPSSRRLRFPQDIEVIITDTVGFIKDLPKELIAAFKATLEELEGADLLLHVVDISNPRYREQIQSVEKIIEDLKLDRIPVLYVFNKQDLLSDPENESPERFRDGIRISATDAKTLLPLIARLEDMVSGMTLRDSDIFFDETLLI